MILRTAEKKIRKLAGYYPVISITGPRQSGKTTLVKKLFPKHYYVNLENPDVLLAAQSDPKTFLRLGLREKMIIDEILRFPELLSYIQTEVDEQKLDGQFIVTGSQNFSISEKVTQSLAGRVGNFTLPPLTIRELIKNSHKLKDYKILAVKGFYPKVYDKNIPPKEYFRDYLYTYVERDVRQLKNIGSLSNFQKFLQLTAGRVGQIVNTASLANDVGVDYKTIGSWLSILEASFIVFRLQPYINNFGKRVIKSPKVFFYDTGLLCYLLGIDTAEELAGHNLLGSVFENFIIADIYKNNLNSRSSDRLYFWRDSNGNELDLIIDEGVRLVPIEIKAGATYAGDMAKGINYWNNIVPNASDGTIIYSGKTVGKIGNINVLNWFDFH
jgi:hypothetical protein